VVPTTAALKEGPVVLDLTPVALHVMARLAKAAPQRRHEGVLGAIASWVPKLPGREVVTLVEWPVGDLPLDERALLLTKAVFPADHLLHEVALGGPLATSALSDPSLLFVANFATTAFLRLDPADKRLDGKQRFLGAIRAAERMMLTAPGDTDGVASANDQLPDEVQDIEPVIPVVDPRAERRRQRIVELSVAHATVPFPLRSGTTQALGKLVSETPPPEPPAAPVAPGEFVDPAIARPRFAAITTSYVDRGHYDRDLATVLDTLSRDPVAPVFVEEVARTDSSDALTDKETLTLRYRDADGRSGTLHLDLPRLSEDGYMRIQGVKYHVAKQLLAMPIIKVRPDEVLVTTAYNKAIVSRFGQNASAKTAYVRRVTTKLDRERPPGVTVEVGSAQAANAGASLTVEYADLGRGLRLIATKNGFLDLSQPSLRGKLSKNEWTAEAVKHLEKEGGHAVGWLAPDLLVGSDATGSLLLLRQNETPRAAEFGLDEFVARLLSGVADEYAVPPSAEERKYAFSRVNLLSQQLPTVVVCGFCDGLTKTLQRAGIEFAVSDRKLFKRAELRSGWDFVRFEDAVLTFDARRMSASLLVNGLKDVDTARPIVDFGPAGAGWTDHVADRLGSPGNVKGLVNFKASFIDPMTAELLKQDGYPTDLAGVLLVAHAMLDSNQYRAANDLSNYRLRGPELIPAVMYKALHKEMERVRATRESAVPQRLALGQNAVMSEVIGSSNVEEVSDLNPLLEAELRGKATWTGGAGGLGDGKVVNLAMRTFHPSMKGTCGFYSPDSSEIGVKRTLTFGVQVKDHRGRIDTSDPGSEASRLLALGELISPFTATHSDPPRYWASCR